MIKTLKSHSRDKWRLIVYGPCEIQSGQSAVPSGRGGERGREHFSCLNLPKLVNLLVCRGDKLFTKILGVPKVLCLNLFVVNIKILTNEYFNLFQDDTFS